MNQNGKGFVRCSTPSGLDAREDGRSFSWLDFDRDGYWDLALSNRNSPALRLYHNTLGDKPTTKKKLLAFRLVGGNTDSKTSKLSNRDAIGARVELETSIGTLVRERRVGEGFGAQNSPTLIFAMPENAEWTEARVVWPSGVTQDLPSLAAGKLYTLHESDKETMNIETEDYIQDLGKPPSPPRVFRKLQHHSELGSKSPLTLLLLTATWCEACQRELPHLSDLQSQFSSNEIRFLALAGDPKESDSDWDAYRKKHQTKYDWARPSEALLSELRGHCSESLHSWAFPSYLLLNNQGDILNMGLGAPSLSELRSLLSKDKDSIFAEESWPPLPSLDELFGPINRHPSFGNSGTEDVSLESVLDGAIISSLGQSEVEILVQDASKHLIFDMMGCEQTDHIEFGFTLMSEKAGSIKLMQNRRDDLRPREEKSLRVGENEISWNIKPGSPEVAPRFVLTEPGRYVLKNFKSKGLFVLRR